MFKALKRIAAKEAKKISQKNKRGQKNKGGKIGGRTARRRRRSSALSSLYTKATARPPAISTNFTYDAAIFYFLFFIHNFPAIFTNLTYDAAILYFFLFSQSPRTSHMTQLFVYVHVCVQIPSSVFSLLYTRPPRSGFSLRFSPTYMAQLSHLCHFDDN